MKKNRIGRNAINKEKENICKYMYGETAISLIEKFIKF